VEYASRYKNSPCQNYVSSQDELARRRNFGRENLILREAYSTPYNSLLLCDKEGEEYGDTSKDTSMGTSKHTSKYIK
jgi:hypothetical protein